MTIGVAAKSLYEWDGQGLFSHDLKYVALINSLKLFHSTREV